MVGLERKTTEWRFLSPPHEGHACCLSPWMSLVTGPVSTVFCKNLCLFSPSTLGSKSARTVTPPAEFCYPPSLLILPMLCLKSCLRGGWYLSSDIYSLDFMFKALNARISKNMSKCRKFWSSVVLQFPPFWFINFTLKSPQSAKCISRSLLSDQMAAQIAPSLLA